MPLVHALGPFTFHHVSGVPDYPFAQLAGETRAGRNGVDLWNLGIWGVPFTMETQVGVANWAAAISLSMAYKTATAADAMVLTVGSVTIPGGLFRVMNVVPFPRAVVRAKLAGDPNYYAAVVRAQWTLQPLTLQ